MQNEAFRNLEDNFVYPALVEVRPLENYCLEATFANGVKKIVDIKPYFKYSFFAPIKNCELFNQVHAEYGGVVWNDEIDLAEEALYDEGVTV